MLVNGWAHVDLRPDGVLKPRSVGLLPTGDPTDNTFIKSFTGKLRMEWLNQCWFLSMEEARKTLGAWRSDYGRFQPRSAFGDLAPNEFAETRPKRRTA